MSGLLNGAYLQVQEYIQEVLAASRSFGIRKEDVDARNELRIEYGKREQAVAVGRHVEVSI